MADDIAAWLDGLGMRAYAAAFEENDVDLRALPHLDQSDLKELGVSLGHRKIILAAIAGLTAPAAPEPMDRAEAERRQLTVMFVDLVGSTELSGRLDPEEMREVITGYQNTVAGVVTRFEGHVAKYMGVGVLCYFGWPTAHEDDAERAARAGLAVMRAMTGMQAPNGEALAARAGIATGLVVVGDLIGEGAAQEEAVVGATPNLAARVQGLAQPGQVAVAEATRRLLGDVFELTDLGVHELKGVAGQTPAWAVAAERAVESRFEARSTATMAAMVGRDNELSLIRERWARAEAGEGQLVLLSGEAGIGKSRITRAVVDAVAKTPHIRVNYQCSPYHTDSSLYPAIQQLSFAAGFQPGDSDNDRLDRLEAIASDAAPLLAALMGLKTEARYGRLGLSPAEQRASTLQALVDQLLALARDKPVLFVLEDAHWIDATTLEMIDLCLDQIEDARVLLLVTARPSFEHGFGGHPIVTRLTLNRLGREQIRAIVGKLTRGKTLPEELIEEIAAKTDGVPLFVEELTKTVLESGELTETETAFALKGPLSNLAIPATLHDSLMARLDRLQPVKEVAQMAACIGREFDHALLSAISPLDDAALSAALERLVAAELIFRRGAGAEARYIFKHALVRDTAYESLLRTRRQALHAKLLSALEAGGGVAPEVLAHHASAANLHEAAFDYWRQAGDAAYARPAYHEASTHMTNAIAAIGRMNDPAKWRRAEVEMQLRLAQACMVRDGYAKPAPQAAFRRARDLLSEEEDRDLFMPVHYGIWIGHYLKAEFREGLALAERLLPEVERLDDPLAKLTAHRLMAATLICMGDPARAWDHLEIAMSHYSPEMRGGFETRFAQELGVQIHCYQALSAWLTGRPDTSQGIIDGTNRVLDEIDHLNTIAYGFLHWAVIALCARDQDAARKYFREVAALADRHDMAIWKYYAHAGVAIQASRDGDPDALSRASESAAAYRAGGDRLFMPLFLMAEAEEHLRLGDPDAAEATLRRAFAISAETAEVWTDPELHRVAGDIARARGRTDTAEAAFRLAVETANGQGSRSFELRAALELARLLHDSGRDAEARAALAPVHGLFTEGFDAPDYKASEALLAKLGA